MSTQGATREKIQVTVEQLQEQDIPEADLIFRLAFGTFLGIPDPANFFTGYNFIRSRWTANAEAFFAAKTPGVDGKLVGTNFGSNWGSIGFFGPLTIHPDYWDRGIGQLLVQPIVDLFDKWGTTHAGLFTFPQSTKHVALYQKFGFWPRTLTALMSRPVNSEAQLSASLFSELTPDQQEESLKASAELTDEIYPGLSLSREMKSIEKQKLGDSILIYEGSRLLALAVCHCGEGTEAGPGTCYIKFGALSPSTQQPQSVFERLLRESEGLAAKRGLQQMFAGVSTSRIEAYRQMLAMGFKSQQQGVTMHRTSKPNDDAYHRAGVFVLDDWR